MLREFQPKAASESPKKMQSQVPGELPLMQHGPEARWEQHTHHTHTNIPNKWDIRSEQSFTELSRAGNVTDIPEVSPELGGQVQQLQGWSAMTMSVPHQTLSLQLWSLSCSIPPSIPLKTEPELVTRPSS